MAKQYVRYSKKNADFIINKMEEELLLVEQVCKKYPKDTPAPRSVYRWSADNEEFNERLNSAYTVWLMSKVAELEEISTTPATELWPNLEFREAAEAKKSRIDTLKFSLGKMAPVLSKRFSSKSTVEHTGSVENTIEIKVLDYGKPAVFANENTSLTLEHNDDE